MSNKSYTQEAGDNARKAWKNFTNWLDEHDSQSWPALGIFFAVITTALIFNVEAFTSVVGRVAAVSIGIFFEAAILAWKVTLARKRNDAKQNQIASIALWLSVILAISMLVVNLFRIGGESMSETVSYILVGSAAFVQVVAYLLFDAANPDKAMDRDHGQNEREVLRKKRQADYKIAELEENARILEMVGDKVSDVRRRYGHLPPELLEPLLKKTTDTLLAGYEVSPRVQAEVDQMADVNGDGKIGGGEVVAKKARPDLYPSHAPVYVSGDLKPDLEALKQLPVDTLFEDVPQEMPPSASVPQENEDGTEPDF